MLKTDKDTPVAITFNDLMDSIDVACMDGEVVAFLVSEILVGSLLIGMQDWAFNINFTIDAIRAAEWTPPAGVTGLVPVCLVYALDDKGVKSETRVPFSVLVNLT